MMDKDRDSDSRNSREERRNMLDNITPGELITGALLMLGLAFTNMLAWLKVHLEIGSTDRRKSLDRRKLSVPEIVFMLLFFISGTGAAMCIVGFIAYPIFLYLQLDEKVLWWATIGVSVFAGMLGWPLISALKATFPVVIEKLLKYRDKEDLK